LKLNNELTSKHNGTAKKTENYLCTLQLVSCNKVKNSESLRQFIKFAQN